ncbi:uncharacterized protein PV06_01874 [Exophiala oligosperma]|uniref:Uncharacterized protein n=1 Tax=Exophiala oligosperma TaxID=215243 RepID=A0A0D2EE41_9EURO|nr:uncharacterized protein PV06_01874 [Exophiala oligosperma]KIW46189.1 hypothetical protein PV06_01874 [Exophiala oligosperma]
MSQPYLPKQPDLKIINYKPGPKTQRLSKSELIEIEPLVLNLHGQGQSREAMRAQCSTMVQKPITLPQLDTIRQRLGLAVYDESKAFSSSRIETDESEMVPGFEHDPQGAEASRGDFRTRERQKDSIMSIEEDITSLKRQSFSHDSFRTQHEIVPNEDTPMANAEQPPGCEETPDPALAISSTSPVFAQDPAEAKRRASNAEICDLVETFARWDPDYKEWL